MLAHSLWSLSCFSQELALTGKLVKECEETMAKEEIPEAKWPLSSIAIEIQVRWKEYQMSNRLSEIRKATCFLILWDSARNLGFFIPASQAPSRSWKQVLKTGLTRYLFSKNRCSHEVAFPTESVQVVFWWTGNWWTHRFPAEKLWTYLRPSFQGTNKSESAGEISSVSCLDPITGWWFGTCFIFPFILERSSSQLIFIFFSEG